MNCDGLEMKERVNRTDGKPTTHSKMIVCIQRIDELLQRLQTNTHIRRDDVPFVFEGPSPRELQKSRVINAVGK